MPTLAVSEEPGREKRGNSGGRIPRDGGNGNWTGKSETPRRVLLTAMVVALSAVLMFFSALVSALVVRKGSPSGDWRSLSPPHILWLNTAVLLASSLTLARARNRLLAREPIQFRLWWRITAILGGMFVLGQWFAWRQLASAGVYLATSPASSFFYVLTGAHGAHIVAGLLAVLLIALRVPRYLPSQSVVDVVSLYWHFMGAIWLSLFLLLLAA